jgi:hypothetical protein
MNKIKILYFLFYHSAARNPVNWCAKGFVPRKPASSTF